MAFQLKGNVFFNDERSLIDVNEAGITTALLVGPNGAETVTIDGQSGIATALKLELDPQGANPIILDPATGEISATSYSGDGSGLSNILNTTGGDASLSGNLSLGSLQVTGATDLHDLEVGFAATFRGGMESIGIATFTAAGVGIATFSDTNIELNRDVEATNSAFNVKSLTSAEAMTVTTGGLTISAGDISATASAVNAASASISGNASADTLQATTSLQIAGGVVVDAVLDEDNMASDSATAVPTQQSVKAYVESFTSGGGGSIDSDNVTANTVTAKTTLTVGEGTIGVDALDVDGSTGDLRGTAANFSGQVDANSAVITNAAQVGSLTFNGTESASELKLSVSGGGVAFNGTETDTQLPTAKAVYDYVDGQVAANNQLMFNSDANATEGLIDLADEKLTFTGALDQLTVEVDAADGNELTFSLRDDVKVATSLIVGEGLGSNAADLLSVAAGTVSMDGNLNVTGNVDSASDRRLKENIEVIPHALDKIEALRGVEYNWIASGDYSAGIIAQEVQAVMPGLVKDNGTHLSVQYQGLIGLLIEAVKEQSARIEELEAKLG